MSTVLYIIGPVFQFVANYKLRSVEGLNPLIFVFPITANFLYVLGTSLQLERLDQFIDSLPFLLAYLLPSLFQLVVLLQIAYYTYLYKHQRVDTECAQFSVCAEPSCRPSGPIEGGDLDKGAAQDQAACPLKPPELAHPRLRPDGGPFPNDLEACSTRSSF